MLADIARRVCKATGYWVYDCKPFEVDGASHLRIASSSTLAPWMDDAAFQDVYRRIRPNTLVDEYRCYELWQLLQQVSHLPGDVLEVGVWRGGTGALLAAATDKRVYLADTYEGVVKATGVDRYYNGGEHSDTDEETVRQLLREVGADATILHGTYPDDFPCVGGPFCFVHLDVDVYQSTKDAFEAVWPQMPVGGVVVFDDYGLRWCNGIPKFVDSLRGRAGHLVMHNLNGHAVVVKTG